MLKMRAVVAGTGAMRMAPAPVLVPSTRSWARSCAPSDGARRQTARSSVRRHGSRSGEGDLTERERWHAREAFLMAELSATRAQVGALLEQQAALLGLLAAASGLEQSKGGASVPSASSASMPLSGTTAPRPATPPLASPRPATVSPASLPSSPSSSASTSSSEYGKVRTGVAASGPLPPAALSIASAIAAVDGSDILSLERIGTGVDIGRASAQPQEQAESASLKERAPAALGATGSTEEVSIPQGPPPELKAGDDDIYWVAQLHAALQAAGFYANDEEVEDWLYGESTTSAVMAFQACNQLAETGVTCVHTWAKLLATTTSVTTTSGDDEQQSSQATSSVSVSTSTGASTQQAPGAAGRGGQASALSSSNNLDADGWPVLMEGDGGAAVHALQVALQKGGFFSGDDDMRWWSFSDSTAAALRFYQACAGLPESGVCDGRTWRALLGDGATPAALLDLRDEMGEYEDDLDDTHGGGRVWLLGEQRWERRQP